MTAETRTAARRNMRLNMSEAIFRPGSMFVFLAGGMGVAHKGLEPKEASSIVTYLKNQTLTNTAQCRVIGVLQALRSPQSLRNDRWVDCRQDFTRALRPQEYDT